MTLLSIEDLVRQTALEESQVRFYESEFASQLPAKIERGGAVFFCLEAVDAFRRLHAIYTGEAGTDESSPRVERFARVMAVTSGKGGVGKSNVALNLAIEFQRAGQMALVLDADLGMANIHLLAGIQPAYTLQDFVDKDLPLSELIAEGPEGVGIIPGGAGIMSLADATSAKRRQMLTILSKMEQAADIIVVDTAAGMGVGVRDFLKAADEVIFVLTPDLTSLADAYGLLKALKQEEFDRPFYSVVNMAQSLQQAAEVAVRFSKCAMQFLEVSVGNIGYILRDSVVSASLAGRKPYTVFAPQARASKNTKNIATALLKIEDESIRTTSAFSRYLGILRKAASSKM